MTPHDLFGMDREKRIRASGIRNIFTPHAPINSIELFFGRDKQVKKLLEQMNTPGQHSLLYGDRGVGKSSLANVVATVMSGMISGKLYRKACDSSDTFESIVEGPLLGIDMSLTLRETIKRHQQVGRAGLRIPLAEAGVGSERETTEVHNEELKLSPSQVASYLAEHRGLLLVDEADAIRESADRRRMAEFIKHLSDLRSNFKVLVVGIAETADYLLGGHPSVERCLKETRLDRMSEIELVRIIDGGAAKAEIEFAADVKERIVKASFGYPHFTQLLALKSAEEAIADKRKQIEMADLNTAMVVAVEDSGGTLAKKYEEAVRSFNTGMYRVVIAGAATIQAVEFSAADLRNAIRLLTGRPISQQSLNNYLSRLVSDGTGTVLRRVAKGMYRFNDPRMPSYVRIANRLV